MPEEKSKKPKRQKITKYLTEFEKRANSVIWHQETGTKHPTYDKWKARVSELQTESGYQRGEAVIRAAKEFACLHRLFREYDVREYDSDPASHATILHYGEVRSATVTPDEIPDITIMDRELSYRENLTWAMEAAGEFDHSGQHPTLCPNNTAWYLYRQAVDNPRDFLTRVGQVETKTDDDENRKATLKSGRRSIAELDQMLKELEFELEERTDSKNVESKKSYDRQDSPEA